MNRSIQARALVAAVLFAGLHCDRSKPTPSAENSDPLAKQAPSAAPSAAAPVEEMASAAPTASSAPPKDAGPDEWYACNKPQDCVLVSEGRCCAPCDPVLFAGYTAVNAKHKAHFVAHEGCSAATCPKCPTPIAGMPRSDANFFPLCRDGRCVAVDLRYSKYSVCQTHKDCALRFGLGCCQGCGDRDLVTFNPASSLDADLCPTKPKCPPPSAKCLADRNPNRAAECVGNYCQLTDN